MAGGYMGKMLLVDLTRGTLEDKELSEELARNFIGGYGIGARILYEWMTPGAEALGPDNMLGFVTGPVTGSGAFLGSRYTVVCKSPVTGGWNDANSGGYFGPELKKAGYDAVFITGKSERPVYLWINEGRSELREAGHLWGKDTKEALSALWEETGESRLRAAVIGPAGENLSLMAAVMNEGHRAAARGGGGAVMGSKNLKAVAVRGEAEVPVANPAKLKEINRKIAGYMKEEAKPVVEMLGNLGTGGTTPGSALSGNSPVKNWDGIGIIDYGEESAERLGSVALDKYKVRKYACSNCPLGCGAEYEVNSDKWSLGATERPEYETSSAFGSLLLNSDPEAVLKANEICNRYGLDTISTGGTIGWAMECYEKGVLSREELDGLDLKWGNSEAIIAMTEKIARQEGCGKVLARGSRAAAKEWGKGEEYLQTVLGIEYPMHDPKFAPGYARTYQFDPTPGRHVKGGLGFVQENGEYAGDPYDYETTGFLDVFFTAVKEILMSAGFCIFIEGISPEDAYKEYLEAVTGWPFKNQHSYITGMRILNMRQAFNLREGLKPRDFEITPRSVGRPPQSQGPLVGITVDNEQLARNFFQIVGWDRETGKPSLESLRGLGGLEMVIEDLYGKRAGE